MATTNEDILPNVDAAIRIVATRLPKLCIPLRGVLGIKNLASLIIRLNGVSSNQKPLQSGQDDRMQLRLGAINLLFLASGGWLSW